MESSDDEASPHHIDVKSEPDSPREDNGDNYHVQIELEPLEQARTSKTADDDRPRNDSAEREFVLKLISLYRDRPLLWRYKSKDYMDQKKRSFALAEIVMELRKTKANYTKELLKKKINSLRTTFNKERRKLARAGLTPESKPSLLYYYHEMQFLLDQNDTDSSAGSEVSGSPCHKEQPIQPKKLKNPPNTSPPPQPKKSRSTEECPPFSSVQLPDHQMPPVELNVIARGWAFKMNRLAPDQRIYAQKIINDVLFEGEMGMLSRNGVSFLPPGPKR